MIKKILTYFFVTLGVIFFLVIIAGIYFFITDPLNLKPLFMGSETEFIETSANAGAPVVQTDKNPSLNESQEKALETVGIDPAAVPSSITPEQEACFIERLGQTRVDEIAAGDSPSVMEVLKAKDCLN